MRVSVKINGKPYEREVPGDRTLLCFLRDDLGLTGTKEGCGAGECGACTVLLDGRSVNSCVVLAAEVDGREVETIEGEAEGGSLSDIQAAFLRHHAVQCGFCSPGMVLSARELLRTNPAPTAEEIKRALAGNFCRCTGYEQIIEAVLDVSGQLRGEEGLKYV